MREPKKKPGEFKLAQKRHQNRQHNSEALKRLREIDDPNHLEVLYIYDHYNKKLQKVTVRKFEELSCVLNPDVLIRSKTGLEIGYAYPRDGIDFTSWATQKTFKIQPDQILAAVVQVEIVPPETD